MRGSSGRMIFVKMAVILVLFGAGYIFTRLVPLTLMNFKSVRPNMLYSWNETVKFKYVVLATVLLLPLLQIVTVNMHNKKMRSLDILLDAYIGINATFIITAAAKWAVGKERPDYNDRILQNLKAHAILEGRRSFPSGHSSISMALVFYLVHHAWMAVKDTPKPLVRSVLLYIGIFVPIVVGCFVCISRIWDNRHDEVDVLVGYLIGITIPYITHITLKGKEKKLIEEGSDSPATKAGESGANSEVLEMKKCP
ncbi:diacylglycerol diphosphate phosphatase / phosphatidate phosphatase [Nematocida ausubeli]|uniref:Phosphatidic acid phosphatase type 2/haloperoxidase domain-containing protein n=1 Tax=Nematocida ausubeli (strain ATCC PRA-371 / ERTm2) TaxID=1913371 RepID=A0A086J1X7_NEMA1|nr:uncharacterized protein NESG_01261 [Nematocida ausubeli]KAI5136727.1 diacylglycerol diphosphate phosphatase / phosphatidate phosphatase [Nematocida ausubeli]KAI5137134.1 diacylglycerol diphosphate phosphatase / phosphatidate phosphatase [Nematocida ausubeli]KAI5137158.1 diacylglycerol diphosphate phosphatase / phosphatidate phosphatase [Nematocida ausubeli]KAI5149392.1 diacylglycerol diphosphate phosphatase / phosphatidate phosphatase [Nematocida ausubeli]KAI5163507.1 diacylglycerol diphosp